MWPSKPRLLQRSKATAESLGFHRLWLLTSLAWGGISIKWHCAWEEQEKCYFCFPHVFHRQWFKVLSPSQPECLGAQRQPGSLKLLLCGEFVSHSKLWCNFKTLSSVKERSEWTEDFYRSPVVSVTENSATPNPSSNKQWKPCPT